MSRASREGDRSPRNFTFDQLPALKHLEPDAYRAEVCRMVDDIVEVGREERRKTNKRVLGVEQICAQNPRDSRPVPLPDWFEDRKRMIVWDDPRAPAVRTYLDRYGEHQRQFRAASERWLADAKSVGMRFPEVCFIPGRRSRPIAHME